jgi:hypothetical protein
MIFSLKQTYRQRKDLWLPKQGWREAVGKEWIGSLGLADANYDTQNG